MINMFCITFSNFFLHVNEFGKIRKEKKDQTTKKGGKIILVNLSMSKKYENRGVREKRQIKGHKEKYLQVPFLLLFSFLTVAFLPPLLR